MTRRFVAGPERNGWRSVWVVDEHGCHLHTEPVCTVPVPWHDWFAEWLRNQPVEQYFPELIHHEGQEPKP
jgi:hypothetical protein